MIAEAGLDEIERIEAIRWRQRTLHSAQVTALAVWKPEGLNEESRAIQQILTSRSRTADESKKVALDEAIALQERVARRKRRQGNGG